MPSPSNKSREIRYLTGEEVLIIHSDIIDAIGGSHGIRDISLFASIIERPKTSLVGHEPYPTIYDKAAVYLQSFAKHQIFIDGNKRTAIASAVRFLETNNHVFIGEIEDVSQTTQLIAKNKLTLEDIAAWLKKNTR